MDYKSTGFPESVFNIFSGNKCSNHFYKSLAVTNKLCVSVFVMTVLIVSHISSIKHLPLRGGIWAGISHDILAIPITITAHSE